MSDFFDVALRGQAQVELGKPLITWMYKPQKSNKFLYYLLGLLFAVVFFLFTYGSQLAPWLRKIPDYAVYLVFILFGPAVNLMRSLGKDQEWTLYEHGFRVRYIDKNNNAGNEKIGLWRDYKSAEYRDQQVTLIPRGAGRRKVKIRAPKNVMEVYSLCRERISIAQAANLQSKMRQPTVPNTPEQRRLAKLERRMRQRSQSQSSSWTSFKE